MRSILAALCVALTFVPVIAAQSLGQIAAEEAARRKAIPQPARVITGDDIKPADPVSNPTEIPAFPSDGVATADPAARRVLVRPAQLQGGAVPPIPVMAIAGGEVFLEVDVSRDGAVTGIKPFRATPPFTEALAATVRAWSFRAAEDVEVPAAGSEVDEKTRRTAASKVLVIGLFRPPALFNGTMGEAPKNVGTPSEAVAVPTGVLTMPGYPAQALFNGVVLLELNIDPDGRITGTRIVRGAPPFDALALEAVSTTGFRPPRVHGRNAPTNVYVTVAFRQPITP